MERKIGTTTSLGVEGSKPLGPLDFPRQAEESWLLEKIHHHLHLLPASAWQCRWVRMQIPKASEDGPARALAQNIKGKGDSVALSSGKGRGDTWIATSEFLLPGGRPRRSQTLENPRDLDPLFMSVHVYISKEHYCGLELSQQGRAMKIMGFDSNGSWDSSRGVQATCSTQPVNLPLLWCPHLEKSSKNNTELLRAHGAELLSWHIHQW